MHIRGYEDDALGYRLWNLEDKKVIRSRDIVFMEGKIIADWESEQRTTPFESTDRDLLKETRVYPDRNQIQVGDQYVPAGSGQETEEIRRGQNVETGQDPDSDSDEELTEKPVAKNQGRRYPLRERRAPRRFPDEEHVLLTDEGEPKTLEEAKRHPQPKLDKCHAERDGFLA